MSPNQQQPLKQDLFRFIQDEFARATSNSLTTLLGGEVRIESNRQPQDLKTALWFSLTFKQFPGAPLLIEAGHDECLALGRQLLSGEDLEPRTEAEVVSALTELWSQVAGSVAASLASRLGHSVNADPVETLKAPPFQMGTDCSAAFQLRLPDSTAVSIEIVIHPTLLTAITALHPATELQTSSALSPKNLDLLLDVEMPVSVSFGRAQLPLKDVIKLTTGSIVELSRSVSEPVDIIVNNCVIARGEVVVVDGNFGVRIKEISSKQERLSTLP